MKLFSCYAVGNRYDPSGLVVAESEHDAIDKFCKQLDEEDIWYTGTATADEVTIEGYRIILEKI